MDLTPEERERIYQEEKVRLEARRLLESQMNAGGDSSAMPTPETNKDRSKLASALSAIGVTFLAIGIGLVVYFGCIFSVVVPIQMPAATTPFIPTGSEITSVNNIGLISDRQNGLIIGGLSVFVGTALLITGLILGLGSSKSAQVKIGSYSIALTIVTIVTLMVLASGGKNSPAVKSIVSGLHIGPDPNDAIARERLKQIGLAMTSYVYDSGEKYPNMDLNTDVENAISSHGLRADGSPTTVSHEAFVDPSSNLPWKFNEKFSGISIDPPLKFDSSDIIAYSPQPTTDGSRYCLFADGHSKKLNKEQWADAVKTTTVKVDPELGFSTDYTLVPQ